MSDNWFPEDRSRPQRREYLFAIVIILLLVNLGANLIIFYFSNQYISDLRMSNENLRTQVTSLTQDILSLQSQLSLQKYLNATEYMLLPQIYNETMFSVVLIRVDTLGGVAQGSGFVIIYENEGYIITNNHVVEDGTEIEVTFIDGTIVSAIIIGTDSYSDLAILKPESDLSLFHPLSLGNSSELMVGETVIAIGNPYGLSNSMTAGIVSQLSRELSAPGGYLIVDVIQTDAAINQGNSGGPMLNIQGEVVGMNTAILTETGEWSGIGFAIPSNTILRELPDLIEKGSYEHPWLGVTGTDMTPDIANEMELNENIRGALIIDVDDHSPSEGILQGGNKQVTIDGMIVKVGGDVITAVNQYAIKSFYDLVLYLERNTHPGDYITFTIKRRTLNDPLEVTIELGIRP